MTDFIVTIDLDWACEPAIEETLDFLETEKIPATVFTTHRSPRVESAMHNLDVGLHPYFAVDSSHGSSIPAVVEHILSLPYNLPAFRCHRFAMCNQSKDAMGKAGMLLSSNVCTDLEIVSPFRDRLGLIEAPIFLEDGSYLWNNHPLEITSNLLTKLSRPEPKVILIHPMHFAINSPEFNYMFNIKKSISREDWQHMSKDTLNQLRWKKRGIRDFLVDLLNTRTKISTLRSLIPST